LDLLAAPCINRIPPRKRGHVSRADILAKDAWLRQTYADAGRFRFVITRGTMMFEYSKGPVNAVWASWAVSITIAVVFFGLGILMWISPRVAASEERENGSLIYHQQRGNSSAGLLATR